MMVSSFFSSKNSSNKKSDVVHQEENSEEAPRHVAIIMDGNNRWAKNKLTPGVSGHRAGVEAIRKVLSVCERRGVEVLTLFAFSSENWQRPDSEVQELMRLLKRYLENEIDSLHDKGVRVRFIGRRDRLEEKIASLMESAEVKTSSNNASTLVLAIDYGGRWDMLNAVNQIVQGALCGDLDRAGDVDEQQLGRYLALSDLPSPDLCIRTGAEHRISNFLLWQLAYAELYFTDCYWPDFGETEMELALKEYQSRQRRFGRTEQQIKQGDKPSEQEASKNA